MSQSKYRYTYFPSFNIGEDIFDMMVNKVKNKYEYFINQEDDTIQIELPGIGKNNIKVQKINNNIKVLIKDKDTLNIKIHENTKVKKVEYVDGLLKIYLEEDKEKVEDFVIE